MATPFKLVFVAGCLRSGTSLLHRVICSSADANPFVNECQYLTAQLETFSRFVGQDSLFIEDYFPGKREFAAFTKSIVDGFLTQAHRHLGSPDVLVLKNPGLSFYVPQLAAFYPDARFVLSVRDPKDTVASMVQVYERHKQNNVDSYFTRAGRNVERLAGVYNNHYVPTIGNLGADGLNLKERVLFARYEDLIRSTVESVGRLGRFCGVSLDGFDKNEQWGDTTTLASVSKHSKWSGYLTELSEKPISEDSIGRYVSVLSPEETAQVDTVTEKARKIFGYQ